LVKSPPELWELVDEPERMQGLMSALLGEAAEIEVVERDPEQFLAWEGAVADEKALIEVELQEKGWGTNVTLRATRDDGSHRLDDWLEAVLDELAEPEKRPFQDV
jgi:hypothetical protein